MALTTESFTSVYAAEVSGAQGGSLTPPSGCLILLSCCVLSVESSITLPLEWWRKCTFIVLHFLYSCATGDFNLKIHTQKYSHTPLHQ